MKTIKRILIITIWITTPFLSFSQDYQLKEKTNRINQILEQYPLETSSFNIKSIIKYSLSLDDNNLIIQERTTSSIDIQEKNFILPFNDIKSQGIFIKIENNNVNIGYIDYGSGSAYIKYILSSSEGYSEGLEPLINMYLGGITADYHESLDTQLRALFQDISDGQYSDYQSTENNDYNSYYTESDEDEGYSDYNKDDDDYSSDDYYSYDEDNSDDNSTNDYYDNYNYEDYSDDYSNNEESEDVSLEYYNEEGERVYNIRDAYYYRTLEYDEDGILVATDYKEGGVLYRKAQLTGRDPNNRNNDNLNGACFWFYENGDVHFLVFYEDGEMMDNEYIEVDEQGEATKIFKDNFINNKNNWSLRDKTDSKVYIESGYMFAESKNNFNIPILIKHKINTENDFILKTRIKLIKGDNNRGHGIIWGFKDWDNYFSFKITGDGYYIIYAYNDGLKYDLSEGWKKSDYVNLNNEWNTLQLTKYGNKIIYSINGQVLKRDDLYAFKGNNIGFVVGSNRKIKIDNFEIKEVLDLNTESDPDRGSENNASNFTGNGTGFFIDTDGYIATNYHVVEDASVIVVEFIRNGEKQSHTAKVIQVDKQNDLAVIKIADKDFEPFYSIPYNFKTQISDVGTNVFALGYPKLNLLGTEIKFTDGKISSKTGYKGDITAYQMTTPIQGGNSGGPLFDYSGNLIGINSSKIIDSEVDNVSYAIKSSYLKNLVDAMPNYIFLPDDTSISSAELTEKIKIISPYVVLVLIK